MIARRQVRDMPLWYRYSVLYRETPGGRVQRAIVESTTREEAMTAVRVMKPRAIDLAASKVDSRPLADLRRRGRGRKSRASRRSRSSRGARRRGNYAPQAITRPASRPGMVDLVEVDTRGEVLRVLKRNVPYSVAAEIIRRRGLN